MFVFAVDKTKKETFVYACLEEETRMNQVELLAPAGNMECLKAAVAAGADAVYLGGQKFGARAFADNFSTEELIEGIRYAHLFQVKIYLTLNTLVKEKEFREVYEYVLPFYEAGLDGVIIQDLGIFLYLQKCFPGLELHGSTQMAVTGVHGAKLLKQMGASRVVLARELSLREIKTVHEQCDIEIEAFIHGAMCYCYSGQCLFSSIIGGRSGNRGRCAQPCRLPYQSELSHKSAQKKTENRKEQYPLSLKDMCTIEHIGELMEAGITSLKIEGRMKSAEYVFGVTAIYRKVIDQYLSHGRMPRIEKRDLEILNTLYIRSNRHDGYYYKHNGKEMISIDSPAYASCEDNVLSDIRNRMFVKKCSLRATCKVHVGEAIVFTLTTADGSISVTENGGIVQAAQKRPMQESDFLKQLKKTGDTWFAIDRVDFECVGDAFVPLKELNELRRKTINRLMEEILSIDSKNRKNKSTRIDPMIEKEQLQDVFVRKKISALTTTFEQLREVLRHESVKRVYLDDTLLLQEQTREQVLELIEQKAADKQGFECFLALPYVFRKRQEPAFSEYEKLLKNSLFQGVLVRNLDEMGWLNEVHYDRIRQLDASVYAWNTEAVNGLTDSGYMLTCPVECNRKELQSLYRENMEMIVYGRLPMMITANCLFKTNDQCHKTTGYRDVTMLTDRMNKKFPILANCAHCYNMILNSSPLSLHGHMKELLLQKFTSFRLSFTTENAKETGEIIRGYEDLIREQKESSVQYFQKLEYTNGHYKRGVE